MLRLILSVFQVLVNYGAYAEVEKGAKWWEKVQKWNILVHGVRHGLMASAMAPKHASLFIKAHGVLHEPYGNRHMPSET